METRQKIRELLENMDGAQRQALAEELAVMTRAGRSTWRWKISPRPNCATPNSRRECGPRSTPRCEAKFSRNGCFSGKSICNRT